MTTKHITLTLLLPVIGLHLSAQTGYSLSECKRLAIDNNRALINSNLSVNAASEAKKEAFTNYFPSVSATGMGFRANDPFLSLNMGGASIGLLEDGWAGAVTLTQPVFTGGKIVYGNKLSALGVEVSKQQARLSENEVLLEVESAYWNLLGLYEKTKTLDVLEKQLTALLNDVEMSYKAGIITNNDVLRVKLKLNEVKSNRVNLDNGVSLCKMLLCKHLGMDVDSSLGFDIERPDMNDPESPMSVYINHQEALAYRAENILLETNVDAGKYQTKMQRAGYLPTVAIGAAYTQNNIMDKWEGNAAVFVSVSVPISGWWGGSHAIRKQRINEQIAYNDKLDGQQQLLVQMQSVRNDMDDAYKQILIAKESVEQSEENLRLNNNYYKAGIIALTDVFDAQSIMQQSRDKYVDYYANYQKKRLEYLQVTGR